MARRSGRARKVGDQVQRELAEIVRRELRDPRVGMITLTGVDMSPDCSHASVFFTCLDGAHGPKAEQALGRAAGFLRTQLAKRVKLFVTPQLHFKYDESVERGDRLSRLIDSVREKT